MFRLQTPLPDEYTTAAVDELAAGASARAAALGTRLVILGHHYQRAEVIQFADMRGDSFGLSRFAADQHDAEFVVFCGVHFMAESADILTGPHQQVILPDLNAGCSMADMADLEGVEQIWDELAEVTDIEAVVPVTYMNSAACPQGVRGPPRRCRLHLVQRRAILRWALGLDGASSHVAPVSRVRAERGGLDAREVLFFPDQHLGRNTGFQLGYRRRRHGGGRPPPPPRRPRRTREVKEATLLLWKGHCSVHQRFSTDHVAAFRTEHPGGIVIVHPECSREVVELADQVGSTDYIISARPRPPRFGHIAVGTEIHLVDRLAREYTDRTVLSLDPLVCPCSTMSRIDLPHLAWVLDGLVEGEVRNRIIVDQATASEARVALERMLAIA